MADKTRRAADLVSDNNIFVDINNDRVGIGTTNPTQSLDINGNVRIRGGIYDSSNNVGTGSSILVSTGTGISWTTPYEAGLQGSQGLQGQLGSQGFQGLQGSQGFQGLQGISNQGVQGHQGSQGLQGSQGFQGLQGISNQGVQGLQGRQGAQGFQGLQGLQGRQGTQGLQGTANQGIQGLSGTAVAQGSQGTQGTQGLSNQGAQGLRGAIGPTASIPDQSVILNDISSSFNGITTQFTITTGSPATNFINSEVDGAARLLISIGGVVQQPDPTQNYGFYISGGTNRITDPIKLNFVEAPRSGMAFFGVAIKSTNSPTDSSYAYAGEPITYAIIFGV